MSDHGCGLSALVAVDSLLVINLRHQLPSPAAR
jgi:hypothetical protein